MRIIPTLCVKMFFALFIFLLCYRNSVGQTDTTAYATPFDEPFYFEEDDKALRFKGYAQIDFNHSFENVDSKFLINRARIAATGNFQEQFNYRVELRLDEGIFSLNEIFLESRHLQLAKIRIGQFKVPFGLSNLRSSAYLNLMERPLIIMNASPQYDIGAMIFGDVLDSRFHYAFGVFNGNGRNRVERNSNKVIVGRIVTSPIENLKIGGSFAKGEMIFENQVDNLSFSSIVYTTRDNLRFYSFITPTAIPGSRWGFDLQYRKNAHSISAEYLNTNYQLSEEIESTASGAYLMYTFLLTGEEKNITDPSPDSSFNPSKGQWGAFELVVRYEQMQIERESSARGYEKNMAVTAGINWYLNDNLKIQLSYQQIEFENPVQLWNMAEQHKSLGLRTQFTF